MIIDWISFTVHASEEHKKELWEKLFQGSLGVLIDIGHGGQGFRRVETALEGARVYSVPVNKGDFYHVSLSGKSCACLPPSVFRELWDHLIGQKWKITRIDLAFDAVSGLKNNLRFTPRDFYQWLLADKVKTFANRRSIKFHEAPYEMQEDGVTEGTSGCYLGSRSSERMVRVYDLHGFTRVEFELKGDRGDIIGKGLFASDYAKWEEMGKSHLRQFVDFQGWDDWDYFIGSVLRSDLKVASARVKSLERSKEYIAKQVSPTLSVLADVMGNDDFTTMINFGMDAARRKGRERYQTILDAVKMNIEDEFLLE